MRHKAGKGGGGGVDPFCPSQPGATVATGEWLMSQILLRGKRQLLQTVYGDKGSIPQCTNGCITKTQYGSLVPSDEHLSVSGIILNKHCKYKYKSLTKTQCNMSLFGRQEKLLHA